MIEEQPNSIQMMHKDVMPKSRANSFFPIWVRQRELRQRLKLGNSDSLYKSLYSSFSPCHLWGGGETSTTGALFSLDFSPDGTLLVAGCDKKSVLMFDPLSRRLIRSVHNAHAGSVRIVKFLDSRIFATGSVDRTVSLWDARNLKSQFKTLRGHSSAIANIEFSSKNEMLITSGVDGFISMWDMNNCVHADEFSRKVIRLYVHLRLRLNPDESKMIISTTRGYLMIVHELDMNKLPQDLDDLELEMLGFAYLNQITSVPCQSRSPCLSPNRRRNRVEIVADFPKDGGFKMISALEIHPQGWSAFSLSTSEATGRKWTCVHDIQERTNSEDGAAWRTGSGDKRPPCLQQVDATRAKRHRLERIHEVRLNARGPGGSTSSLGRESVGFSMQSSNDPGSELPEAEFPLERGARERRSGSPADAARARSPPPGPSSAPPRPPERAGRGSHPAFCSVPDPPSFPRPNASVAQFNRKVHVRFPRLTHYIEEPYSSGWYIQSLGVSADGRLVCSPVERGIRLLTFSPECSEQSVSWSGRKPRRLHELSTTISHTGFVRCTKFSPRDCLLVSGCFDGKLAWYQPVM